MAEASLGPGCVPVEENDQVLAAWCHLRNGGQPSAVDVWQRKPRSTVVHLVAAGACGEDVIAKRTYPERADVEHTMYSTILPELSLTALHYYGRVEERQGESAWIFVERAPDHRYDPACAWNRELAANWLGTLHGLSEGKSFDTLPDRGADYYRQCLESTIVALVASVVDSNADRRQHAGLVRTLDSLRLVETHWPRVVTLFDEFPRVVIHGDLFPKNMRILDAGGRHQLITFDWEQAGWGPPFVDLAQQANGIGEWASPDLPVYFEMVRHAWPHLTLEAWNQGASVARLLHYCVWCKGDVQNLGDESFDRPLIKLEAYAQELVRIIGELRWLA